MALSVERRRCAALQALLQAVRTRAGVARVSTLLREGHARHHLRAAVEAGALVRVRRDWVATPDADAELVGAARCGVVLTCVTRARRLGLWVLGAEGEHVAADPHARVTTALRATVHWAKPVVPRLADALEDDIENVLAIIATCQPHERALAVWESAYRRGLVDPARLARLELPPAARRILAEAEPFADSGLETIFSSRLRRFGVTVRVQIWIAGHHVDHLIGERLVVRVDGGHHVDGQRMSDNEHDIALRLLGYTVIRVGYRQIVDDWPTVQWLVMQAMAQGLHLRQ
ncbi:endonuclease domain-containing protein [Microbacterium sp. F51-2R]|uniref:endonuclease domain-containing protein n=1 Tax=Microbacterium sp. F51-2R TaxID=3445777 RepID=UPI003FA0502A